MENIDLRRVVDETFTNTREMVLATCIKGIPWSAVLVYGHDADFNLYWVSNEDTRHSMEIKSNPNVAATITMQPTGDGRDIGLQIAGQARILEEEEVLGAAREYFAKRGTDHMPKSLEDVNKLTEGRSWYMLKPTKIFVINEPLFGYGRVEYNL